MATLVVVDYDACRQRKGGLAVGGVGTAEEDPAIRTPNFERRAAVGTLPRFIEPLADDRRQGLTGVIDTQFERITAIDRHLREPTGVT